MVPIVDTNANMLYSLRPTPRVSPMLAVAPLDWPSLADGPRSARARGSLPGLVLLRATVSAEARRDLEEHPTAFDATASRLCLRHGGEDRKGKDVAGLDETVALVVYHEPLERRDVEVLATEHRCELLAIPLTADVVLKLPQPLRNA